MARPRPLLSVLFFVACLASSSCHVAQASRREAGRRVGAPDSRALQGDVTTDKGDQGPKQEMQRELTTAASNVLPKRKLPPRGTGWWSVKGGNFFDAHGRLVRFSGVNWSGFETPDAVVHGIERRSYQSHLDQMKRLGFNLLRLPFAGDTLLPDTYPRLSIGDTNPELKGLNSLQVMDRIIRGCAKRGIKVILDYHRLHLTVSNELGTWWDENTPEETWVTNWMKLAKRYRGSTTVIGADLFNEVHPNDAFPAGAPFWVYDAGENEKYNFRRASLRVIRHIHAIQPNWIIFLEGMHNDYWWGGDVAALLKAPINWRPNKIAFSAHEYGPYVYPLDHFFATNFPKNLPWIFHQFWGSIQTKGIKPVWVGEFGSFYPAKDSRLNTAESTSFETLVRYIGAIKASWTIFQWTPDSKDTGGILSDDWVTPDQRKLRLLKGIMHPGFQP